MTLNQGDGRIEPEVQSAGSAILELERRLRDANVRHARETNSGSDGQGADLHLLIDRQDISGFPSVMADTKAIRGWPEHPATDASAASDHWFVPDFASSDYLHLEVTWKAPGGPSSAYGRGGPARGRPAPARFKTQGMVVALIGADGSGKSTQAARLATIFGRKLFTTTIYLGSGDGGSRLRQAAKRGYHQLRGRGRPKAAARSGPGRDRNLAVPRTAWLRQCALALERYANVRRASRAAAAGAIVISDRWPQNLQSGVFDGPGDLPADASRAVRLASALEQGLYRKIVAYKPTLSVHLVSDFETSQARKPGDLEAEEFKRHADLMSLMRAQDPRVQTVDARQTQDEVTRDLFRCVWLELWKVADATPGARP